METQKKIREMEIDNDMKIEVVENAFMLMVKYNIQLSKSDVDRNVLDLKSFFGTMLDLQQNEPPSPVHPHNYPFFRFQLVVQTPRHST